MINWTVYLSGEIHTDWREKIEQGVIVCNLPIEFTSAVTDHEASDAAGDVLGEEASNYWRDHKSAKVNAIRTKTLIEMSDIVVVRFGDKYRQWNAAFDAGQAAAMGKPYIVIHPEEFTHALKEVDAQAMAVAKTTGEVVKILHYIATQK